jgi:hypothetical protein
MELGNDGFIEVEDQARLATERRESCGGSKRTQKLCVTQKFSRRVPSYKSKS